MTDYLLDSDILIFFLRGQEKVVHRMEQSSLHDLQTTTLSSAELWCGNHTRGVGEKQNDALRRLLEKLDVLPFCEQSALLFAEHKAALYAQGNIIGDFDIAIAAIALTHRLTLVTNNVKDFKRIRGLKVENWAA